MIVTADNYSSSKPFSYSVKNSFNMRIAKEKFDEFLDGGIICGYVMVLVVIFRLAFKV